ncbi:transmembrane protein 266 [Tachyglossus aculeatus]|uniref:transmembrane protein 266 n=1 Tax=Tachyglossus aculeatus TaxID=9261 RepID=UPI0018F5EDD7|nr:transmembrane protein 266 [Tachyglossus aculeatus]XP_038622843.1 transmembrane protein 266 [Tachyglossus aculeatus]XP_038622844.1 transmembrane protein 266 [Tachyglossus aculeatus]XP_038622845.1 transmembrane protein 266 [Tachyglossus aculeatus]XP_038622846.1 transmembrane protein 266 [Tachyglossus aculeatus]
MTNPQPSIEGGVSEVEIISQQVEEETKSIAPVQLVNFAYRDLPLAALDLSAAGSQLLSNLDEEYQREGSNWLKPCCGRRAAVWQVFLLSASLNSFLVACVILVVILLTLELLIDIKLLQFSSASQFASVVHWISLIILSVFFTETILRIVVLGIWDYIENKIEVFDGAVIILSLAPMVASTVANGPSSPWDAISLIITLRIWRVKRIIDAYVLPVKVEMEMVIQQYEKAKVIQDEQLERLTQICQEQGFEIRQLRAHLAQQDLDLAAEREAALQVSHVLDKKSSRYKVVDTGDSDDETTENITNLRSPREAVVKDDMNNYISQYYNEPSTDSGVPEPAICVITTAAIDIHHPNVSSDLFTADVPLKLGSPGTLSRSIDSSVTRAQSISSQTFGSSTDCSTTREESSEYRPLEREGNPQPGRFERPRPRVNNAMVQELLSSLSEDSLSQKGLDPVNLKLPSPTGSPKTSPQLEHRVKACNQKNQEDFNVFQIKPVIHFQPNTPVLDEKYRSLESKEQKLNRVPES